MVAKRHHFVPQGYLRGFAAEDVSSRNYIWVYDKNPGRPAKKKSIRSIAWAPAYYAIERADGSTDADNLEIVLARTVDNEIPEVIRRIPGAVGQQVILTDEDRGALAFFVGLSLTRVPSFRDGVEDVYTRIATFGLSAVVRTDAELGRFVEEHGVSVLAKDWTSLRPMITVAQSVAESALQKNWQFFVPPVGVSLVTSDNPVVFSGTGRIPPGLFGPAHPQAELLINLRKDLALVCTPKTGYLNGQTFSLNQAEARKFNKGVIKSARRRIFADSYSDKLDKVVKKYYGEEQRVVA